jgi:hypothetical protein
MEGRDMLVHQEAIQEHDNRPPAPGVVGLLGPGCTSEFQLQRKKTQCTGLLPSS